MDPQVPLVVPEVNASDLDDHQGVIANPNCSTIIMVVALWPLYERNRIERVVVSTYQAISGAGAAAMAELEQQTRDVLDGKPVQPKELPYQIAFNLFSHNTTIGPEGYCEEEEKMIRETHKMFHDDTIRITPTCIRVPVPRTHSETLNLQFEEPITEQQVREILRDAPGVSLVDDREANHFPMPLEASGEDDVFVGRIRQDMSQPDGRGIDLFLCGDQLRKGAALNAVQIAESLIERGLLKTAATVTG
jgi:aspartate-semialdehyde dehydrogenase